MRKADFTILYDNVDITRDIREYVKAITYTDRAVGRQDDISIVLQDKAGYWRNSWFPIKGSRIDLTLYVTIDEQTEALECGTFEVDDIDYTFPPNTMTIKALALPINGIFRGQTRSRSWQNTNLKNICIQLAKENNIQLFYDTTLIPDFKRIDQRTQTDARFLADLCKKYGMFIKVSNGQLIVYEQAKYDNADAVMSFDRVEIYEGDNSLGVKSGRFNTTTDNTYTSCVAQYYDYRKQELLKVNHAPKELQAQESGRVLKLNERYENKGQAMQAAKAALSLANANEFTGNFSLLGNAEIATGVNITCKNWGAFDGKYALDEVRHQYSNGSGYLTDIKIRNIIIDEQALKNIIPPETPYIDLLIPVLGK